MRRKGKVGGRGDRVVLQVNITGQNVYIHNKYTDVSFYSYLHLTHNEVSFLVHPRMHS